jgi:hypothetical protein
VLLLLLTLLGWLAVFAKTGSGLDVSVHDYVARAAELPSILVVGDALADYRNWSLLPLVLARAVGAGSSTSFAAVQCAVLVAGSSIVIAAVARRRAGDASRAVLALFATAAPAYAMTFMGSYDQLLIVALLALALAETPALGLLIGAAIGLTHAESGAVSLLGLLLLSAIGVGPAVRTRVWTLIGLVGARIVLTVVLVAAGQPSDRFTYIREYGVSRLLGYFAATWPVIVLTMATGGWLIIAAAVLERRSVRFAICVAGILAVNLGVAAVTIDQSRVAMLTTLPLVVTLAVAVPVTAGPRPRWARLAPGLAAVIGLVTPLVVSWVGEVFRFGDPLQLHW